MVRYNINQNAASVMASPFIPSNKPPVYYKLNGKLSNQESSIINDLINQVNISIKNNIDNKKNI